MNPRTSTALRLSGLCAVVLAAYGAGVLTTVVDNRVQPVAASAPSLLDEAADRIAANAARPVDRDTLERAGINGMLRAVGDEWSRYLSPSSYQNFRDALAGRYSGVGLWVTARHGQYAVTSVAPDTSASRAGVLAGDRVLRVDGTAPISLVDLTERLRGPAGTTVTLTVSRDGLAADFSLSRSAVAAADVSVANLDGDTTVIKVTSFSKGVAEVVRDRIASTPGPTILDLRDNPGGLVTEAVDTAAVFLDGGPVVSYVRRAGGEQSFSAPRGGQTMIPLVVLVNRNTASAAEIVAAALQDRDRAVIVGTRTFGKGSVQEPTMLSDGSALELTVGRYRTSAGRILDQVGVIPDVRVGSRAEAERRAYEVVRGLAAASR